MVNYQQGKIYKIQIGEQIYVGSTTKKLLCNRRNGHVADSKRDDRQNHALYSLVNTLPDKWQGVYLELLEDYPCESKDQLHAKEAEWVRKIATLNHRIPRRSHKAYYEENKDEILQKQKLYNLKHKKENSARNKEYRVNHHEKYAENSRRYQQDTRRDEYLAYQKKYSCIKEACPHCGAEHRKGYNLQQHILSKHSNA